MLEQKVHECLAPIAPRRRVEEVGVLVRQCRIDEAAGLEHERRPVQRLGQRRRHDGAQHAAGMFGLAEHALEQEIVRVRDHPRATVGAQRNEGKLDGAEPRAVRRSRQPRPRAGDDARAERSIRRAPRRRTDHLRTVDRDLGAATECAELANTEIEGHGEIPRRPRRPPARTLPVVCSSRSGRRPSSARTASAIERRLPTAADVVPLGPLRKTGAFTANRPRPDASLAADPASRTGALPWRAARAGLRGRRPP